MPWSVWMAWWRVWAAKAYWTNHPSPTHYCPPSPPTSPRPTNRYHTEAHFNTIERFRRDSHRESKRGSGSEIRQSYEDQTAMQISSSTPLSHLPAPRLLSSPGLAPGPVPARPCSAYHGPARARLAALQVGPNGIVPKCCCDVCYGEELSRLLSRCKVPRSGSLPRQSA
jgi:hypothetical protein